MFREAARTAAILPMFGSGTSGLFSGQSNYDRLLGNSSCVLLRLYRSTGDRLNRAFRILTFGWPN
jgi:hypothetical protein